MKQCGIYQITNLINQKQYIGQSIDITRRWWEHKARAFDINNNCYHKPLYQAFRKYGLENFELIILELCEPQELNEREAYYIEKLHTVVPNGYNILATSNQQVSNLLRCKKCGARISHSASHGLCRNCYSESVRVTVRPSREELKQLIRTLPFTTIGLKFNVTDNAVRKWCDGYNLPRKKKIINQYTDQEWELI